MIESEDFAHISNAGTSSSLAMRLFSTEMHTRVGHRIGDMKAMHYTVYCEVGNGACRLALAFN